MMRILGLIPARGGSKGIPDKNIKELAGKPLIAYTIKESLKSRFIDRLIVSTDSEKIVEISKNLGAEVPFLRLQELAQDDTPMLPVIKHAIRFLEQKDGYKPDYIILLQPTSPLRNVKHIDEALEKLTQSDADSIVSVQEVPHSCNPYSVMKLDGEFLKPFMEYDEIRNIRQMKPTFYARNGAAIYAFTYDCLMDKNSIYGDKILPYFMKKEESFDIDDIVDFRICELIIQGSLNI